MELENGRDPQEMERQREIMREHGWMVMLVGGDAPFGYTIGISQNFGQPELFISGLNHGDIHWICNEYGAKIKSGWRPSLGDTSDEFLKGETLVFGPLGDRFKPEYLGVAVDHFDSITFPAIQGVWSLNGVYPTQREWPKELRDVQFLLSMPDDWETAGLGRFLSDPKA